MPWGFEPLHPPFPLARWLVGVFRAIVEVAVLAMFHTREDVLLRRAVTFQLIRDDHPRDVSQPLEQFAEELLGGFLIPAALDQNIEHVALVLRNY